MTIGRCHSILRTMTLMLIVGLPCSFGYDKAICADDDVNTIQKRHVYTTPQEIVEDHLKTHQEPIGGGRRFGVFINTTLYEQISDSIWTYIDDLESDGWQVALYTTDYTAEYIPEGGRSCGFRKELEQARGLKDALKEEYQEGMAGCILIGDLPVAWFEDEVGLGEGWPIALYHRDMDGEWTDSDGNGLFDQQLPGEGDLDPEIWTSRLYAETLDVNATEKVALIENYFRKNHAYREGTLTLPKRGLDYAEDDWAGRQTALTCLYNDVTLVDDNQQTSAGDYLHRLTEGYELVRLWAHGWGTGHGFPNSPCKAVAYAHCYVYSPLRQDVQLRVGSDDGIKVWLNGINVCTYDVYREHRYDDNIVEVVLNQGWNRLLIKVSDKYGDWGLSARFSDLSGYDVNNLSYWLNNQKPQQPPLPQSGYIRDWLCNGWYKNQDDQTRLSQDYLGAEASAEPSEGEMGGANEWKAHHSPEDYVDLDALFGAGRTVVRYRDIINIDPRCFFYDVFSCGTFKWWYANYIDAWYIFTDSYGLASWGLLTSFYEPRTEFYTALGQGKCLGEAQLLYLNVFIADEFNIGGAEFGMFGDPTLTPGPRPANHIYVDDDAISDPGPNDPNVSDPNENGSAEHPFDAIEEAIDVAIPRDIVIVLDGTYNGSGNRNMEFHGKSITVRSQNGPDRCIIDCEEQGRAFYFCGGEDEPAVLSGFTVKNAYTDHGGAIRCLNSSPKIVDCIFRANTAGVQGGAILNSAGSSAIFENCLFCRNSARLGGAMASIGDSSATISNCTFTDNSAWSWTGRGIVHIGSPTAALEIRNCILWNEAATNGTEVTTLGQLAISFSAVRGGQAGISLEPDATLTWSKGNINADPLFADPDNDDYHLKSRAGRWAPNSRDGWVMDSVTSPCIDTGDPNSDWSAELWPHGKRINMGAYGGTAQASMSQSDQEGNPADFNDDDTIDMKDFVILAAKWTTHEALLAEDIDRDGHVDFSDFAEFADNWLTNNTP